MFLVYIHTNKINNKKYIGITSQKTASQRWGKNGKGYSRGQEKFYNAILKYGWNNFIHSVVANGLSKNEALDLEENLINKYDSINNGYNSYENGRMNYMPNSAKEKLREKRIGKNNPNYNPNIKHKYTKSRDPIIQAKNKREYYSFPENETSTDGRKSSEFKNKLKELKTGENNPNYGKHTWSYGIKMSDNQKQKMKEAYTEKRKQLLQASHLGAKNPNAKKVLCVNNKKVYDTIVAASKDTGVSERTVSDSCNNHVKNPKIKFVFYKEGDGSDPE